MATKKKAASSSASTQARGSSRAAVELHLKNAKLKDLDEQAARLADSYQVYRTVRRVSRKPGEFKLEYQIRGVEAPSRNSLSGEQLRAEAARYRILRGIKEHVMTNFRNIAAFDLAFDLSCREIPELEDIVINPGDIATGPQF